MNVRIHPTAIVEDGVEIGDGTSIWDNVHIRGPSRIGRDCIIGGKTYIAYGVEIGDRVKVNSFVYIPTGVTVETGVMIAAGTIFANDRFPRATTPDLSTLRGSGPDEHTEPTVVREGATLGAGCRLGPGIEIGAFALVGMGSVVTRSVFPHALVAGNPAKPVGLVCRCGERLYSGDPEAAKDGLLRCEICADTYRLKNGRLLAPAAARA
ncbi:dTDP-3-amino-3,6-dideoxy-alpha-D-galactopyranose 3-N-acetyltransferase [Defluviimonas aquaemixtae]|uniref:dTDP-3-amino-3,6-dideoxy-alpha-D-galactopyranose 3-N-acetyltransferase n=1 Tax=Albidovulum aquaemixtae TaxID=1542388 RepID=A0A2R8B1U0_9RHOB|nr:acyltransferase [Defluviimonas aquaemixtae]SPH16606.1 dTDP-3-amino-3,6-dideoxy-alpha-D-galactopyranose 3-N-acetyltransferase [Defluviimonas aquaemixtae]